MKKIIILLLISFSIGILTSIALKSAQWLILATVWFAISAAILMKFFRYLTEFEKKIFLFSAFFYPISESLLKILIGTNFVKVNYDYINTCEHFLWPIFFGLIIFPALKNEIKRMHSMILKIVLIVGIVNIFGVLNEQFEFLVRYIFELKKPIYYSDTIKDLTMNLLGSMVLSIIIYLMLKNRGSRDIDYVKIVDENMMNVDRINF